MYLMRVVLYDFLPEFNTPVNSDYTIWAKKEVKEDLYLYLYL